jgi:hypothetical protein
LTRLLEVISLGGGVQSSAMALMAEQGILLPRPDAAIFADTGHEPDAVPSHTRVTEWHTSMKEALDAFMAGELI